MYSCPTDDIHSIYLDGELPEAYVRQYEEHLERCSECRGKCERMRRIKELLLSDSRNSTPDSAFMAQSFERLETKMRYSKNTRRIISVPSGAVGYGIGAAAAVLLAVIVPVRAFSSRRGTSASGQLASQITPIERPAGTSIANRTIVINGNINDNLAHTVSTGNFERPRFADVDVFRPEFTGLNTVLFRMDALDFEGGSLPRIMRYRQNSGMDMEMKFPVPDMQGSGRE